MQKRVRNANAVCKYGKCMQMRLRCANEAAISNCGNFMQLRKFYANAAALCKCGCGQELRKFYATEENLCKCGCLIDYFFLLEAFVKGKTKKNALTNVEIGKNDLQVFCRTTEYILAANCSPI